MKSLIAIVLLIFLLSSCGTKKNSSLSADTIAKENSKMIKAGYTKGEIITAKSADDCDFSIKVSDKNYFLDPINISDEFKKDGIIVWFKFNGLRRQNRCKKANPIHVVDMQITN